MKENTARDGAKAIDELFSDYDRKMINLGMMIKVIGENVLDRRYREALRRNPELKDCEADTMTGALLQMISLRLDFDHVDLRGEFINGQWKCVFAVRREGHLELNRRCG
jgi:hypothetical protein